MVFIFVFNNIWASICKSTDKHKIKTSHIILIKETNENRKALVVSNHKEIDKGTLKEIIRQAGLKKNF
ncbi:MAG: type II toxin-antitoxin system HicA family toxin [Candidatus Aenigmarchaeota archaeon]|nr:type II toxin-antitoxin system HicA family toxin [Candidatus Aenigmarchaeota archaeon]